MCPHAAFHHLGSTGVMYVSSKFLMPPSVAHALSFTRHTTSHYICFSCVWEGPLLSPKQINFSLSNPSSGAPLPGSCKEPDSDLGDENPAKHVD